MMAVLACSPSPTCLLLLAAAPPKEMFSPPRPELMTLDAALSHATPPLPARSSSRPPPPLLQSSATKRSNSDDVLALRCAVPSADTSGTRLPQLWHVVPGEASATAAVASAGGVGICGAGLRCGLQAPPSGSAVP